MRYPTAKTIHFVVDDLNPHHRKSLTDVSGEEGRNRGRFSCQLHPEAFGSRLNQADIKTSLLWSKDLASISTRNSSVTRMVCFGDEVATQAN
jgi:hypothetical protein